MVQTPEEALAADAELMAAQYGISKTAAVERLRAEQELPHLMQVWRRLAGERLAGMYINPGSEFKVVIRLTGSEAMDELARSSHDAPAPVELIYDQEWSEESLQGAIRSIDWASVSAQVQGVYADVRSGEIVVHTYGESPDDATMRNQVAERSGLPDLPIRIERVSRPFELTNRGGRHLSGWLGGDTCTSGFTVRTPSGTKGVATAAHCINQLYYWWFSGGGPFPMSFQGGENLPWADIQWHTTSAQEVVPLFHVNTTEARTTLAQGVGAVGQWVCTWGVSTGNGCTYVLSTTYAPTGPGVCGGPPCNPSYSLTASHAGSFGDSGGPWYTGNTAHGFTKGQINGVLSVYTRVWYLNTLGVSLLIGS